VTRLLTCGWETGDINERTGTTSGTNAAITVVTSTPTPRSPGSYCLKCTVTANGQSIRTYTLAASKTELWVRVSCYVHFATELAIVGLADSAGARQMTVSYTPTDSLLRAYRGDVSGGTLLGTSSPTQMTQDAWHTLELRWKATTTTSSTDGIVEVWVDGTRWINLTAVDNTNTANLNVQGIVFGGSGFTWTTASYLGIDDFAVNDVAGSINNGQIYDGRVVLLKPNGAGSNTGQTRGGTDSGANWSQVDERPPSLTDYVYSATAATRDTYALDDVPAGTWAVNCVEVLAYAQNSDAGAGSLGLTVKSGSTTNEGTAQSLTTSGAYYRQLYETDPDTSAAWTTAAVTALEAGTTVR
jgi:hypothetical protein